MSKVLLIEDDPAESRLYQRLLTIEGFEVMAITNGSDCRASALTFHPDIILMDIMMPKMNGFEALDVIHFDERLKHIPVVMLTNLSDQHYKDEALRRGAVQFVVKSQVENKEFIRIVHDVLNAYTQKAVV